MIISLWLNTGHLGAKSPHGIRRRDRRREPLAPERARRQGVLPPKHSACCDSLGQCTDHCPPRGKEEGNQDKRAYVTVPQFEPKAIVYYFFKAIFIEENQ